jgi:hypothetical protein
MVNLMGYTVYLCKKERSMSKTAISTVDCRLLKDYQLFWQLDSYQCLKVWSSLRIVIKGRSVSLELELEHKVSTGHASNSTVKVKVL